MSKSKNKVMFLFVVFLLSIIPSKFSIAQAQEDKWITLAPMPTSRRTVGLAIVDEKIYAIGGWNDNYVSANEMYDPNTNKWTAKASMPTPRHSFAIFVIEDKIHIIGGYVNGIKPTRAHEVYDTKTNTWETKNPTGSLVYRENFDTHVVNGKVYILGGQNSPYRPWPSTNKNTVYDPTNDTWTEMTPMLVGTTGYASAVVENKIYVIGGRNWNYKPSTLNFTQIYDTQTDTWSYGTPLSLHSQGLEAGATTGRLAPLRVYAFGGAIVEDGELTTTQITRIYDPKSDNWFFGSQMRTQRTSFSVAVVKDSFYLIGGTSGESFSGKNERYTPTGYGTPDPNYNSSTPTPSSEPSSTPTSSPDYTKTTLPSTIEIVTVVILVVVALGLAVNLAKKRKDPK